MVNQIEKKDDENKEAIFIGIADDISEDLPGTRAMIAALQKGLKEKEKIRIEGEPQLWKTDDLEYVTVLTTDQTLLVYRITSAGQLKLLKRPPKVLVEKIKI
ncbi:MAG: hypothetical protein RBR08_14495 [Desulforegulaceae bacterium]|nr:hypothetical protein [Desulforegulaceae bacterium]